MTYEHTLPHKIQHWATETPDAPALRQMRDDGSWDTTTWGEYWTTVRRVAKGLALLGHEPGQPVAIVGDNRREWVLAEFGIMASGGCPAPIYTTNTTEQVAYIVRHSKARIAICDRQEQLDKYLQGREQGLIDVDHIVVFDDIAADHEGVMTLDALMTRADADGDDAAFDARMAALTETDIGLLIYTSGTTGQPKGAEYTHANMHSMSTMFRGEYETIINQSEFRYVSYLPLCHAAEQTFTNFCGIESGGVVHFCPEISRIKDYLLAARPTVFFAVPRVWEKFQAALEGNFAKTGGFGGWLIGWARRKEAAAFVETLATNKDVDTFGLRMARKLVINKVKGKLGLDRLVVCGSGAAPISRGTLDFFTSVGIVIHEGFGMTETTGVATTQPLGRPRFGTIGVPFAGVEARISDDGEIQLRGPNMVNGYRDMVEETAELYSADGWLQTGDLGTIDDDGFLRITGRKKDLLITAGGKNVAPAEMEGHLKGIPGIGQAVVVGDRQPYLCALLVLEEEAIPDLCKAAGVSEGRSIAEYASDADVQAFLQAQVESECNAKVARYQTIKKFEVLAEPFSVETGELTPTMKVKRNVVNEKYGDVIARLYG